MLMRVKYLPDEMEPTLSSHNLLSAMFSHLVCIGIPSTLLTSAYNPVLQSIFTNVRLRLVTSMDSTIQTSVFLAADVNRILKKSDSVWDETILAVESDV